LEARGLGGWRAEVDVREGEQVVLRQAYDTGWRATVDGHPANVRADPIGQLQVDVATGPHVVEIEHRVHTDFLAGLAVALGTAVVGMSLLGLGLYGTVRTATGSTIGGLVAALAAIGSMATWTWIVNGGVYARVFAAGLAACACWAAARWLGSGSRVAFAATALLLAAAIASHQFVGAVFAFGIGVATLAHAGPACLRRALTLAVATFLLASPAIVPALVRYGGFASAFLGLDRPSLTSPVSV